MITAGTSRMMPVVPTVVVECRVVGEEVQFESGIGFVEGILSIARVVGEYTGRINSMGHAHLVVVLSLWPSSSLIVEIVDYERRMVAVALYHACQLFVTVSEIECRGFGPVIESRSRVLISARFFEIEQS